MGLTFAYPAFLWALAALAIPVIIHLFSFRRYKTVYFPNVAFLQEVKQQTDSRTRLKHWLVLLSRLLLLAFLVLAFAQPSFKKNNALVRTGKNAVSIYIDNSFSMQQTDAEQTLLERARRKAYEVLDAYAADDEFQIITNDFNGKHLRTGNKEQAKSLVDEIKIAAAHREVSDVMQRQSETLSRTGLRNRDAFVISDFQKTFADFESLKPDTLVNYRLVSLQGNAMQNLTLDTCWLAAPVQVAGRPVQLIYRVTNYGDESVDDGRVTLTLNDQVKAISDFTVGANGTVTDTINFTPAQTGWLRGKLQLQDQPVIFDDAYYFTFEVSDKVNVLAVNGRSTNPFLDALFRQEQYFEYTNASGGQVDYSGINKFRLVVLNEPSDVSSGFADVLVNYMQQGGNVLFVPPANATSTGYDLLLSKAGADAIGAWTNVSWKMDRPNLQQDVWKDVFEKLPENLQLPTGQGYFALRGSSRSGGEQLMRTQNGDALLTLYRVGGGMLFVSAVPFDRTLNNIPLSPLFAPLLYRMTVVRQQIPQLSYTLGSDNSIAVGYDAANGESLLKLRGNDAEFIPSQRPLGRTVMLQAGQELQHDGIYEIVAPNATAPAMLAAFNYDRDESNPAALDGETLEKYSKQFGFELFQNQRMDLSQAVKEGEQGIPLWKYCVMLALLFMITEVLLLRFLK